MKREMALRLRAAELTIGRMERLRADDPEEDQALEKAWEVSVAAASAALRAWVDGKPEKALNGPGAAV